MEPETIYESPDSMKEIRFNLSLWHKTELDAFAKENGMSTGALLRFMINQSIKTGFKFLIEKSND